MDSYYERLLGHFFKVIKELGKDREDFYISEYQKLVDDAEAEWSELKESRLEPDPDAWYDSQV